MTPETEAAARRLIAAASHPSHDDGLTVRERLLDWAADITELHGSAPLPTYDAALDLLDQEADQ